MFQAHDYPVPDDIAKSAWLDEAGYRQMYERSISDPDGFWREQAARIDWIPKMCSTRERILEPAHYPQFSPQATGYGREHLMVSAINT